MFVKSIALAAAFVGAVSAQSSQFSVITPNANTWWVANSANVFSWTCNSSPSQTFTVLIGNSDINVLVQPIAVIGVQQNADCSKTITQQQANFTAGSNYFLQLANPLNSTEVYAQSEPFEVRALGSPYPTTTSTPAAANTGSPTGSGSGSGSAAPAEQTGNGNGASSLTTSVGVIGAAVAALAFLA